jgi:hypothetical protein
MMGKITLLAALVGAGVVATVVTVAAADVPSATETDSTVSTAKAAAEAPGDVTDASANTAAANAADPATAAGVVEDPGLGESNSREPNSNGDATPSSDQTSGPTTDRSGDLAAQAAQDDQGDGPAELRERVLERWGALIKRDFERAYEFLSPGQKALLEAHQYRNLFGDDVGWKRASIINIEQTSAEAARVRVQLDSTVLIPGTLQEASISPTHLETWVRSEEQWWYVP